MERPWFKQKRYGFGATPASWEGWALTAAYFAGLAALGVWLGNGASVVDGKFTTFAIVVAALTMVFLVVCWRTTEGGLRWRWGRD
jgi:uncharacterized membrane protein